MSHKSTWINTPDFHALYERGLVEIESLRQQLAECQATNGKLNGVLCEIANSKSLTATPTQFYQHLQRIASNATFESFVATALNELIAERTASLTAEVERLKAALTPKPPRDDLVPHAYELEDTHNNAEFWYRAGHSEEAAAKGESVICMAQAVFAWKNAAYAKAEETMKLRQQNAELTAQRDTVITALETARALLVEANPNCSQKYLFGVITGAFKRLDSTIANCNNKEK